MNKKYFFFDIDGTLTDRTTHKIVPSAYEALHSLQDNGHFVALATGRAHYKAQPFLKEIGLENMVCCGGGGLVINNELIENIPLNRDKALAIIHQAEQLNIGILLMLDDSLDCYSKNNLFIEQVGERSEPTNYIINPNLDYDQIPNIYKIYLALSPTDEEKLTLKDTLGHLRFDPNYLMFQYDAKKEGIIKMMKYIGGDLKDVVVFGDDNNDIVMFDPTWFSIAMGNASEQLKQHANYITASNINDGIYQACKKFKWI